MEKPRNLRGFFVLGHGGAAPKPPGYLRHKGRLKEAALFWRLWFLGLGGSFWGVVQRDPPIRELDFEGAGGLGLFGGCYDFVAVADHGVAPLQRGFVAEGQAQAV